MLELFPVTAAVTEGELAIGSVQASALADEFGTPLIVYCERTLLDAVRAYRSSAPEALIVYGVKAFPNIALLDLFGREGLGADVSTLGELAYATRAGVPGERIVVHGNNKSDEELRAAAEARVGYVVIDALAEIAVSKEAGLDVAGLHVHIGSQLLETQAALASIDRLAAFAATARDELGWTPAVVDLGGGLGVRYVLDELPPRIEDFVSALMGRLEREWSRHDLPLPQLVLEPGRSLVGRAGTTLYRVGVVKKASETTTYVAIDGGMSDNPRPQLYGARHSALLASRIEEDSTGSYVVCGKHCESGDVLIPGLRLPEPRRGDLLAVPATGGYTLAMGSNYNAVPRPAAVLVRDGEARLIRRRETIDDLLALDEDRASAGNPR